MTFHQTPITAEKTIPAEIRDAIIDLMQDEPKALAVCAGVHWTWRPRALGHLFHSVYLRSEDDCRCLMNIIRGDFSIAAMVLRLSLAGEHELSESAATWVTTSSELRALIDHCHAIKHVTVLHIDIEVARAIADVFRLQQLELLHLLDMNVCSFDNLLPLIANGGRLTSLRLSHIHLCPPERDTNGQVYVSAPVPLPSVTCLDVAALHLPIGLTDLRYIAQQIHYALPSLRDVSVDIYDADDAFVLGELASLVGAQLQYLELDVLPCILELAGTTDCLEALNMTVGSFDLAQNTGLRRLSIAGIPVVKGLGAAYWLSEVLANLAAPDLQTLQLHLWLFRSCEASAAECSLDLDEADWMSIDQTLCGTCPSLRVLQVQLHGACDTSYDEVYNSIWLAAEISRRLPALAKTVIVDCDTYLTAYEA